MIYTFHCKKCGKEYSLDISESRYKKGSYTKYCSISCRNSHIVSDDTKKKISDGVKSSERYKNKIKEEKKYFCGSKELDDLHPDISKRHIEKWFKNLIPFGFDINSLYSSNIINEYEKVKSLLYEEYVINELSPRDIWKKYNCKEYINNSETLLHIFKTWKFPIRGWSKSCINSWMHGKLKAMDPKHFKQDWHKTLNGKEVYLHSSYELDYAKELDDQQIDYDVEYLRIKYWDSQKEEFRCAIPDFYIPSTNTIIEIKSSYTLDKQNMKDKMKAYLSLGYNFKLICDHNEIVLD